MNTEYAVRDAREEELDTLLTLYRSYYQELKGCGMTRPSFPTSCGQE